MNQSLKKHIVFIYGLPGFPLAMLGIPLFVYLPSFYNQQVGLSLFSVGLALLLARMFDVITDPVIGLLNDRFPHQKSKIWRRKTYIVLGLPLLLIGLNYLLKPNDGVGTLYLFTWSFVTYLGWTMINIPWLAMGAEMTDNYHEKSTLSSSREIFAVIGTVLVISLPVMLAIESDLKLTLATLANLLTILLPLSLIPLLLKVSIVPKLPTSQNDCAANKHKSLLKTLFVLIKLPAIKRLLPAYFINSIANALPATLFILYVGHVLVAPEKVGFLLITYFLSAIVGIPVWLVLAKKTDKHISWSIALCGAIASFMWVPFLGQGDFIYFLMVCLLSGFCLGADVVIPASIQADIAQLLAKDSVESKDSLEKKTEAKSITTSHLYLKKEESHTVKNNTSSTGVLFGLWGLITKLSLALAIGIAFPLLDLVGLDTSATSTETVNDNATLMLIVLYALIPIIMKLWVLSRLWGFPFDKAYFSSQLS